MLRILAHILGVVSILLLLLQVRRQGNGQHLQQPSGISSSDHSRQLRSGQGNCRSNARNRPQVQQPGTGVVDGPAR